MASSPTRQSFASFDGTELVWYEMGQGRPVLLLHGLFSGADVNWIKFGHAEKIASRGFRVIMPDLRAHGESGKPHERQFYPPDVLARDGLALLAHLELSDYDLGGYSLGARTTFRMVLDGAKPRRVMLCGMGLSGLLGMERRADHFRKILRGLGSFERGSPEWMAEAFLKTNAGDPAALLPLLDTFIDLDDAELDRLVQPTLVLCGDEDEDNGSAQALAERLPDATLVQVPGGHMNAVTRPAFGRALAEFLAA